MGGDLIILVDWITCALTSQYDVKGHPEPGHEKGYHHTEFQST